MIGEIKLDTKSFYNAYVRQGTSTQFEAIVNYADKHSYGVATLIALKNTREKVGDAIDRKVKKLGLQSSVYVQLVSVLPQSGGRSAR